jgi:O-methyltransferase involved in polyketide biosynthesis
VRILSAIAGQELNISALGEGLQQVVILGRIPEHVTCVPIDFNTEARGDRLLETGYPTPDAVVFDYVFRAVLEGARKHGEITNMRRYRFMSGEGLTFGIAEGADLTMLYFNGKNASRRITGGYGIAAGMVRARR